MIARGATGLLVLSTSACLAAAAAPQNAGVVAAGVIGEAQIAPDGRSVVFTRVASRGGMSNLWRIPFPGGEAEALTTTATQDSHPRWSPDGGTLAFLSRSLVEGSPRRLVAWPSGRVLFEDSSTDVLSFEWSAGGRHVACMARRKDKAGSGVSSGPDLFVLDVASRASHKLKALSSSSVLAFDWTPTGTAIAVIVSDSLGAGHARIVVATLADDTRDVASVSEAATRLACSKDGTTIAWLAPSAASRGESRAFVAPASGGPVREFVMRSDEAVRDLSWRAEGRLALSMVRGSDTWIDMLDPVGEVRTSVLPTGLVRIAGAPSWSADGSRYAVVGSGSEHAPELFVGSIPQPMPRERDSVGAPPTPVRRITFFSSRPPGDR